MTTSPANVVALRPDSHFSGAQLDLIRRTVAADCNVDEFNLFIAAAQRAGLDPLRKQIGALVFSKGNADKRRMAIVTFIDGLRAIADRSGDYSPDENEPAYEYDPELKGPLNPLGLVKATVIIRKKGKRVPGVAYWDEFAPLKDEWAEDNETGKRRPTGRQVLEQGNWTKMGRLMLAKCAEAQALRKAFPEDTSGLYEYAELDQAKAGELLPSEIIGDFAEEQRLAKVGGAGIMLQMGPDLPLENVPLGRIFDQVVAALPAFTQARLAWFRSVNTAPLREFWARSPGDALELKKRIEARAAELDAPAED